MHPAAKLQFERVTREYSLWRSVQVASRLRFLIDRRRRIRGGTKAGASPWAKCRGQSSTSRTVHIPL